MERHEHVEQGQTMCNVCEWSGLKTSWNLLIKTDLINRLREVIEDDRLMGGREFQSLGKRWKKVLRAADEVLEEWINFLWDPQRVVDDEKKK